MQDHTTAAPQSETVINEPRKCCTNPNCERAGQLLPLSEFHKDRSKTDGHLSRCKRCCCVRVTQYRATDHGRKKHTTWNIEQKKKHGITPQVIARHLVNVAVRKKKMPKPTSLVCSQCGQPAKEYHHHLGYEPEHYMDVIPVCIPCHAKLHHQ